MNRISLKTTKKSLKTSGRGKIRLNKYIKRLTLPLSSICIWKIQLLLCWELNYLLGSWSFSHVAQLVEILNGATSKSQIIFIPETHTGPSLFIKNKKEPLIDSWKYDKSYCHMCIYLMHSRLKLLLVRNYRVLALQDRYEVQSGGWDVTLPLKKMPGWETKRLPAYLCVGVSWQERITCLRKLSEALFQLPAKSLQSAGVGSQDVTETSGETEVSRKYFME